MPRPTKLDAVIFDFDGVVSDTELPKSRYIASQLAAHGVCLTEEEAFSLCGGDDRKTVPVLLARHGSDMTIDDYFSIIPDVDCIYAEGDIVPSPGFVELVRGLRERGVRTAIASSTDACKLLVGNERMGISDLFDAVVGGDTVDQRIKPEPDVYVEALRLLDVSPERAVAVEDSPFGIAAAHAAGLYVIGYCGNAIVLDISDADEQIESFWGLEL